MKKIILGVLAVILISGASYAGWQTWQDKQQSKKPNTNTIQTQVPTPTKDPSEGGKYLVIKEWGVRVPFEVTGSLDTEYKFSDENLIYFHKKGLDEQIALLSSEEKTAFAECVGYPVANIVRVLTSDIDYNSENTPFYLKEPERKIGAYSYLVSPPNAICPKALGHPKVAEMINTYVTGPYKSKRIDIINAFEEVKD